VRSILTGQVGDVVSEIEFNGFEREIRVRDLFANNHIPVAVVTGEGGGSVGPDVGGPNLELFGGDFLVVGLKESDFIEEPIRLAVLGDMLCTLGVENTLIDGMPVPLFGSGELPEVLDAERLLALRICLHRISFCCALAAQDQGAGVSQGRASERT